jgi:2',3'-cyclic-nucleotide 2'-phosphodiesterase (5'-nucleotidase family)
LRGGGELGDATRGEVIVAAMNQIAYDAMALGPNELELGADVLAQRLAEAEFPVLSANVVRAGSKELYVPPYVVIERGGHHIGVIGLTRQVDPVPAGFEVRDPVAALTAILPEVSRKAETIILLTNLDFESAQEATVLAPGVDLIVAANPRLVPDHAVLVGSSSVLAVTAEKPASRHTGRRIGRLNVTVGQDGSLNNPSWSTDSLDGSIADDSAMDAPLKKYEVPR